MSWAPCKISTKKAILASHPELTARFLKESSKGKKEFFPEIDHMDLIVRQETLPMVAGHPVMLQLCTVPAYALTIHKMQSLSVKHVVRGCLEGVFVTLGFCAVALYSSKL